MAAIPARGKRRSESERREEVSAQGEMSPQLRRALQVANAARARAARIRAEFGEVRRPPTRPPGTARIVSPPPRPASSADPVPDATPPVLDARPDVEHSSKSADVTPAALAPLEISDAAPPEPAEKVFDASAGPAEAEPAPPPSGPSGRIETETPAKPRFARTCAAIQANRLSGWAIELKEPVPDATSDARPRFGRSLESRTASTAEPAPEATKARALADSLGQITPGRSRPAAPARAQPPVGHESAAGRSARKILHQPSQPNAAAPSPSRDGAAPATAAARTGVRAAYRSVRNSAGLVIGVVIGALLLAGLRSDGTQDVVRSVWSMKPPRPVTVERVLTLDLPPFEEVVEVAHRPVLKVADAAGAGAAETTASAPGGGDGGAGLDFLDGVAADDPRVEDLAAVARREPSRWDAFYDLGHVMQSRGDLAAAERLYRRALSLNPRHAALAYDLGYVLQRRGDFEAAREQYRAALALKPDHAYALYNLGALLRREGAYAEAAELLERAGRLQEDNPDLFYEWARTLEARGRPDQAIDLYKQAAALSPDRWPGPEARARMQTLLSEGPQVAEPRS